MSKTIIVSLFAIFSSLTYANAIESISIDLSSLHPGSVLSGSVMLANPLGLGDSALIPLSFSDPSDYRPDSLTTTLSVINGVPLDQFRFSTITFTNLANNKTYNLTVRGAAQCVTDFPCQATGGFQANDPPAFFGTYTISAALAGVPEPGYGWLSGGLGLVLAAVRRRLSNASR